MLTIVPRNARSLSVYLIDFASGDFQIGLPYDEFDVRDEDVRTPADVDAFLMPAIEGRVRILVGPHRAVVQTREQAGYADLGSNGIGLRSLLPLPGWRKRASIVDFSAYRSEPT